MNQGPGIDALSDPDEVLRSDPAGLLLALARSGAQVRSVAERTAELTVDPPRGVLIAGSTAVRDTALVTAVLGVPGVPVVAMDTSGVDASMLPAWVGPLDLVVVLAGTPDDPVAVELARGARHRGAALLVRGADHGPVADVAGAALFAPGVGAPEILAGPGRLALLLRIAAAAGVAPGADLGLIAAALDAEALSCGPAAESFTNPGIAIAHQLWDSLPLLVGSDPVGQAVAVRAASTLGLVGGAPAATLAGAELLRTPQLLSRLVAPSDPFADPFLDEPAGGPVRLTPVLIAPPADADDGITAVHRELHRLLTRAAVVADDGTAALTATGSWPAPGSPAGLAAPVGPLGVRAASALRVALRLDYAAVYLGIAGGQLAPIDAPVGLGPVGSAPPPARPATVEDMSGELDGPTRDSWDEATWN